ncbi:MAG: glutaredoxin 3 [Hyphomicrobiales bacterium]|nr:glutaredoxin 3 [Hyphomicrobiales bacterium]
MADITIYTGLFCGYCARAKAMLTKKGATFTEIDVSASSQKREEMVARAGGRQTVPQIFIGDRHVGGSDDLQALDAKGELDSLLVS